MQNEVNSIKFSISSPFCAGPSLPGLATVSVCRAGGKPSTWFPPGTRRAVHFIWNYLYSFLIENKIFKKKWNCLKKKDFPLKNWNFHIFFENFIILPNFEIFSKEKVLLWKIEIFTFFENFIIFQHFGEEAARLLTKVSSSSEADTHRRLNFSII